MLTFRITRRFLLGAAILAPTFALAQPPGPPDGDGPPPPRGRRGGPGGGPGDDGPRPPGPPIMAALDTNRDGELSPEEIRNAAAALRTSSTTTATACLTTPSSTPAVRIQADPMARPTGLRKENDSAVLQQTDPMVGDHGGRFGGPPADGEEGPPDEPRAPAGLDRDWATYSHRLFVSRFP